MRGVAAVVHRRAVLPLADGLLRRPEPLRQNRRCLVAGLDRRPNLGPSPLSSNQWRTMDRSSFACEDGSAWPHPVPNAPQSRSCHEKRRTPRVSAIIRDETGKGVTFWGVLAMAATAAVGMVFGVAA